VSYPPPGCGLSAPSDKFAHASGMSLIDGCPECVLNTEAPTDATPTEGGWRCAYRCSDCGHRWTTSWGN
jgi:hypothetical protein